MHVRNWLTTALVFLVTLGGASAASLSSADSTQADELRALDGEWIYVEDRTEGRALEQQGPPISAKFSLRIEEGAVILASGHGSGHRDVPVALDGSATDVPGAREGTFARYRGEWTATRAVFENPRHDYPKRIAYKLSDEGALNVTIGFSVGGTPRQFEFNREGS